MMHNLAGDAALGANVVLPSDHRFDADCYCSKGNLKKAVPLFEACLEGRRSMLGDEHPDTYDTLKAIGDCWLEKGQ